MSGEEVESIYELSPAQQGMLFQSIYAPGSGVYVLQLSLRLSGKLDLPLFERAWQRVVERHPILRTAFYWEDLEKPVQVVYRQVDLTLERESWRGLDAGEQSARLERYLVDDRERGFEPEEAPLMRLALFEVGQDLHHFVWSHHHLLNDGWSQGLLMRELFTIYSALASGREPVLDRPRPYREYIVWLQRQDLGEAETFWRRYLAGLPAPTLVSGQDGQQAVATDFRSSRRRQLRLGADETAALREMARRHRLTLNTMVQGAWALLLARSLNVRQVVFGAAVAGRPEDLPGAESIIGPFINTLPMRVDLAPESRLASWLAELQEGQVEQRRYAYAPLYEVQQWSEVPAGLPLFDCILAFENYPLDSTLTSLLPGIGISEVRANELTNFPLELVAVPGNELLLEMRHDLGRFEPARVARMLEHLAALLRSFARSSGAGLWELPALLPAERHQILLEWNDTSRLHGLETSLHGLFERQAESAPDAVAAWFGEAGISYCELDRRAERLARHLAPLDRPDTQVYVALCMDRSLEMLIGLAGTLKAGLAYVPLEPAWPAERKRWILDSLQVPCAVTGTSQLREMQELQWQLPALAELIVLDAGERRPPPEPLAVETVRELWDGVAERAGDRVSAGGFVSSYTGRPFTEAEVDEYRDRVVSLASPWIRPDARVLEIGSGSGLILFEIAPRVAHYVGLDPSGLTQERNREAVTVRGLANVALPTAFAHELDAAGTAGTAGTPGDGLFDLVIIASTAQFFPGPLYLERVLSAAFQRLAPGGAVLVADVPDLRRREEFRASLEAFRAAHRGEEGLRIRSRFDELYLDEDLFQDLAAELPDLAEAEVLHRRQGFDNELRFRYDVLLRKAAPGEERGTRPARRKEIRTFWHLEAREDRALPHVSADAIAYVIFTSGSTGTPKGVVVRHRPAVHLVDWVNRTFAVGPRDRVLFITSPCFDLSVYDVFGLLGAGGSLRIASGSDLRDPERLVRWLIEDGITFWDSAPAALQQLVPFLPPTGAGGKALRLVFLSGDWIPLRLPDSVRESFPEARVISLGGATEATIWSNFFLVRRVEPGWASIPYGRPIHDASYFVLDSWFEPCPVGVAGDLYIGGECLASGYAGDPALTASKFLPDPWSLRPGGRLYRTGDLARFFSDGNIEFLGRADHQVKVRGFRIELGEIEATLLRHPSVREAVVVALGTTLEDRRLAAYVVADPVPAGDLKSWLQERLTDVMVPSTFTFLDAMPVTANGKLDRKALPEPGAASEPSEAGEGPRTPLEERLCAIFSELLKIQRVHLRDSFFELGGHSLLATLLLARVRTELGVHLSLGQVFREPTVAGLAALVLRLQREQEGAADSIVPGPPPDGPVPLSPGQRRLWFVEQLGSHGAYNIAAAVRLVGPLDLGSLARTLAEVARRHETLRTRFEERSGQPVQVIEPPLVAEFVPELPLVDLAVLPDGPRQEEARRLAAATARSPFHLGTAPLLRCLLLRLDAGEHAMVCSMHHIISDGWSLRVLVRELAVLYRAFSRGLPSPLPEPPVQYRDFVLWEQRRLAGQVLDEQLDWWRKHLAGAPAFLTLPADRPRPPVQSFRGSYRSFRLDAGLTEALRGVTAKEGCTLFMLLLAAWQTLLHYLTGQDDIVVNAPLAFREQPEIEGAIGFFAQTLLFRIRFAGATTFSEVLGRVRAGVEEAYLRPYAPLDRLVEELAPERNLSYTPFMQAGINYIDAEPLREPEEAGLKTLPFEFDPGTSQFDLSLALSRATDGLEGGIQFRTDLFGAGTVTSFIHQLRHLLELVAARPEVPLQELGQAIASEAERLQAEANREMQQASRLTFQRRQRRGIDIASAN
ncbi:MAG TPA: amino acid adenylation domain-containing protein [Thermoanaerobaculia bacterium]|nr:amino acid adenylation domain-containing protein [Thermoanaerobaculia bacterium]